MIESGYGTTTGGRLTLTGAALVVIDLPTELGREAGEAAEGILGSVSFSILWSFRVPNPVSPSRIPVQFHTPLARLGFPKVVEFQQLLIHRV
jgi:hypothetical protein